MEEGFLQQISRIDLSLEEVLWAVFETDNELQGMHVDTLKKFTPWQLPALILTS